MEFTRAYLRLGVVLCLLATYIRYTYKKRQVREVGRRSLELYFFTDLQLRRIRLWGNAMAVFLLQDFRISGLSGWTAWNRFSEQIQSRD
jgi:hypothetical protein